MSMEIRKFEPDQDYEEVASWWKAHKWPAIPLDMLPKTGFIVEEPRGKMCAGWLYKTDSKIAWIEFIVSSPHTMQEIRGKSLDLLMVRLVETAKSMGFKSIFSSINNPRLVDRYKKHGFIETEKNMSNMIMRIN